MDVANMFESSGDFSSDDSVADPNYTIPKINRKRSLVDDDDVVNSKTIRGGKWTDDKLIFTSDFYHIMENTPQGKTRGKCATCGKIIACTGEVTSNFITHSKVRYAEVHARYITQKQGPSGSFSNQGSFEKRLIRAIVDSTLPVSIVDKQSFKDLFLGTGLNVISKKTAMKSLDNSYSAMLAAIQNQINASKYFCTTADIWSGNKRSFLGYTCHWLDENFERKSAALACRRISGIHSAERISLLIDEINRSFHLNQTNVLMTITDNGSNFVKAFRDHGLVQEQEEEEETVEESISFDNARYLPQHARCASHTLSLLGTTDYLKILKDEQTLLIQHTLVIFTHTYIK